MTHILYTHSTYIIGGVALRRLIQPPWDLDESGGMFPGHYDSRLPDHQTEYCT